MGCRALSRIMRLLWRASLSLDLAGASLGEIPSGGSPIPTAGQVAGMAAGVAAGVVGLPPADGSHAPTPSGADRSAPAQGHTDTGMCAASAGGDSHPCSGQPEGEVLATPPPSSGGGRLGVPTPPPPPPARGGHDAVPHPGYPRPRARGVRRAGLRETPGKGRTGAGGGCTRGRVTPFPWDRTKPKGGRTRERGPPSH